MALNVKGAMLVCMACISAGTWLIQRTELPVVAVASPMVEADAAAGGIARASESSVLPVGTGRERLVRQFDRPSAFERQATQNRDGGTAFAARATPSPAPVELPPMVLPLPETVVAAAQLAREAAPGVSDGAETGLATLVSDAVMDTSAGPEPRDESRAHRVARGETLVRLAERYFGSREVRYQNAILASNSAVANRGGKLLAGEVLRIPSGEALAARLGSERAVATESATWYTIQPKDSLSSIARRYLDDPDRWREIVALNAKLDPRKIVPGMRIKLPPGALVSR